MNLKKLIIIIAIIMVISGLVSCDDKLLTREEWEAFKNNLQVFYVYYDGNESESGSAPVDNNEYSKGDTVNVPNNYGGLWRNALNFAGWNENKDGTGLTYHKGNIFIIESSDVTLYAKWTDSPCYNVLFQTGDGSTIFYQFTSVEEGDKIIAPPPPVDPNGNGTFAGWFKDVPFMMPFNFTQVILNDTYIYAKFE